MKLIRDRTPNLLRGTTRKVRDEAEHDLLLRLKLYEEAGEASAATSDEELVAEFGDLYEVMNTLLLRRGLSFTRVLAAAATKAAAKGGFVDGLVLEYDPLSNKIATADALPDGFDLNSLYDGL